MAMDVAALEVEDGGPATLAGDARCDMQGHSAKYDSYTLMWTCMETERQQPHHHHGNSASVRHEPTHLCITYSV